MVKMNGHSGGHKLSCGLNHVSQYFPIVGTYRVVQKTVPLF